MSDQVTHDCALKWEHYKGCTLWCRHPDCQGDVVPVSAKEYSVGAVEWISPLDKEPPRGKKINILQGGGIAIHGQWEDNLGYLAWQDLFKRNYLKEREYKESLERQEELA
jgi:hypothetical protein